MKKLAVFLTVSALLLGMTGSSQAFWWLFGQSKDGVSMSYLFINDTAFDESDDMITLYEDYLADGLVHIRGRAVAGRSQIGSVMVSLDGRETWHPASLSVNGAFEYSFRPEIDHVYHMYIEAMETAGRTNDVDETYKQVIVTQADVRTLVSDALDRLFSAYTGRDLRGFMLLVSPDFVGDDLLLERAVADDFRYFDDIRIAYSIVSVSSSSGGRMFALISYDRSVVSSKDGKTYRDSGLTELTLTTESDGVKIYSMKQPIIFGVSGATDIAAGTVLSQDNGSILHVDDTGQATLGPPDESGTGGDDPQIEKETITLRCSWGWIDESWFSTTYEGYRFHDGAIVPSYFGDDSVDFLVETNLVVFNPMVGVQSLGTSDIDSIREVPLDGYVYDYWDGVEVGMCYALHLPGNTYAILRKAGETRYFDEHGTEVGPFDEAASTISSFELKYRSDGERRF